MSQQRESHYYNVCATSYVLLFESLELVYKYALGTSDGESHIFQRNITHQACIEIKGNIL